MRYTTFVSVLALILVASAAASVHAWAGDDGARNRHEARQDRQELRQDNRQVREDALDVARLEKLSADLRQAISNGNNRGVAKVDAAVAAMLHQEAREGEREERQDQRELRRDRKELRGDRRELRQDRHKGAGRHERADDRRDRRDDRRDRRDDRHDAAQERSQNDTRESIALDWGALEGQYDSASLESRTGLMDRLVELARQEVRQDGQEKTEDRREQREDRRERREDRRQG